MDIFQSWIVKQKVAHRGLHNDDLPENSLAAFGNAIDNGYAIELDVRAIDDGTVIVFHDDSLNRMTSIDRYACSLKREELDGIRLLKTDERIPTLAQTLEYVAGRTPLLIEIKNEGKIGTLERDVLDMLKGYEGDYAVQSFNPYSLEYFRTNAPNIWRGQLSSYFVGDKISRIKRFVLKRLMLNKVCSKPHFISYNHEDLPNRFVKREAKRGCPVLAWTIRSNSDYHAVKNHSDNIIFEGFVPQE